MLEPTKPSEIGRPIGNGKLRLRSLLVSEFSCCLLKTEGIKRIRPWSTACQISDLFGKGDRYWA